MLQQVLTYWWLIVMAAVVLTAAWTDVRSGKIYNWLTYPAVLVGLGGHTFAGGWSGAGGDIGLSGALAGLAMGFFPMLVVARLGGRSMGDAKLLAAVGALGGWKFTLTAMIYMCLAAALLAVVVTLRHRVFMRTVKRIALFLWQAICLHRPNDPASADSPTAAFALAVYFGVAGASLELVCKFRLFGVWF